MTTREEIEAAAAKAGLRVSSALPSPADGVWEIVVGRYLVEFQMDTGRAWAYRTESGGTLVTLGRHARIDGAFAAIAADIDKIAACRVRPADDVDAAREQGRAEGRAAERADVVAWLEANAAGHDVFATLAANESTQAEQATASRVAMTVARKIESGRHVGAATVSPEPPDSTDAAPDPDPLALPEGMEWRQDGNVWDVWEGSVLVGMAWPVYGRWKWACFAEQSGVLEAQDEHSARCALAAHLRERAGEER